MRKKSAAQLKRAVSEKSDGVCEYCRSQKDYSPDPFAVEHILPRVRGGTDALENLALSCHGCNGHKSVKISALDTITREEVPLFHPRRQQWHEHFEWNWDYTIIIGRTPVGRATIEALQMNRLGVINLRRLLQPAGLHPPPEHKEY
jgi:hypothetical protein